MPAVPVLAHTSAPNPYAASLEDLLNMQVTSVSKKEQSLSKAGAAVFVSTQEDIRRSGATDIPDLLRMVPGRECGPDECQYLGHQYSRLQRFVCEQGPRVDRR